MHCTEAADLAQDNPHPQSLYPEDTCGEAWHAEIDCELALMARAHDADSTQAHRVREHNQLRRYVGEAQGRITSDIEEIQKVQRKPVRGFRILYTVTGFSLSTLNSRCLGELCLRPTERICPVYWIVLPPVPVPVWCVSTQSNRGIAHPT